jgi:HK97 family phage portal protein
MYNPFKKILKSLGYGRSSGFTVGDIISVDKYSNDLSSTMNYAQLADSGYIKNYVSNKCIRATMQALGDLKFDILINGENIKDKNDRVSVAFKNLVRDPNTDYSWCDFIGAVYNGRTIEGSGYIYPEFYTDGRPMSVEYFRPDRVTKICSEDERIHSYLYSRGSRQQVFKRDEDGRFDLLEWRAYDPLNDINGLSSVRSAGLPIDGHTGGLKWNKSLVENGGKFSGIASIQDAESGQQMSSEQLQTLERKFNEKSKSVGSWMVSDAPIKLESMGLTATEMDWLNGIKAYAIGIANSLDYPPYLLGLESTTFNNQAEAKMDFYESSVLPKANDIYGRLSAFYSRKLGMEVEFRLNLDKIIALVPRMLERSSIAGQQFKDGLISQNEARDIIGMEETPFGEDLFVDQNNTPAFGAEPLS